MMHYWCYFSYNKSALQYVQDGKHPPFPLLGALFYYCPSLFIQKLLDSKVVQYVLENITIQNSGPEYYWKSRRERVFHGFPLPSPPQPTSTEYV